MKHLKEDMYLGRCKTHGLYYLSRSEILEEDISFYTLVYGVCPKCNTRLSITTQVSSILTLKDKDISSKE